MFRFFNIFVPSPVAALLTSETLLIGGSYWLPSFVILPPDSPFFHDTLLRLVLVLFPILLSLYFLDLYSAIYASKTDLASKISMAIGVAFLSQAFLAYPLPNARIPIRLMLAGSSICALVLFCWRRLYTGQILRAMGPQKVLFVGSAPLVSELVRHIDGHPELGLVVAGCISDDVHPDAEMPCKVLGPLEMLNSCVHATKPWKIVVGMTDRRKRLPLSDLLQLWYSGYAVEEATTTHELLCGRVNLQALSPGSLIYSRLFSPTRMRSALQRAIDLLLALGSCVVAVPLSGPVALVVRLSSPGPILYRQKRSGQHGRVFTLLKFRSMYADAEEHTGPVWASANDPRITPVGRILRRLRLDEIPQLWNVLRGDMSIVGPRPERPEIVKQLTDKIPYFPLRHAVKPGITGWAQINHRYSDTLEDTIKKLEYDLYYIKHMSLGLNAYIIFQTAKIMLLSRGAQ